MATKGNTANSILSRFTYQALPRIVGVPTYQSITLDANDLKANASSINSKLGRGRGLWTFGLNGAYRHVYHSIQHPLCHPSQPRSHSTCPWQQRHECPTCCQPQHICCQYLPLPFVQQHTKCTEDPTLSRRRQHLRAHASKYSQGVRKRHCAPTPQSPIRHLDGQLTPMAVQDNDTKFWQAYNPANPFELLIQQIEDAQSFAAAGGQAYMAEQIVSNAYYLIHNTGMFFDACHKWYCCPNATKTWAQFKTDFAQAHMELCEMTHTTQAAGYHNANNVSNFPHKMGEALANLATATAADCDMLCSLQGTNEQLLVQQNAVKDAKLIQLWAQVQ
jgi:hypothetical protein